MFSANQNLTIPSYDGVSPNQTEREYGYTLQTLIIIAILVLGATIAFTIIYAILDDSTDNIVGGSESFSGIPGPPQNVSHMITIDEGTENDESDDEVNVAVSWDLPSYGGEGQIIDFEVKLGGVDCVTLVPVEEQTQKPSQACSIKNFDPPEEKNSYDLVFKAVFGGEGGSFSYQPIRVIFPINGSGDLSQAQERILKSQGPVGNLEFDITPIKLHPMEPPLLEVNITSGPCNDGYNDMEEGTDFILYWSSSSGPQTVHNISFSDCRKVIPIDSLRPDTEYSVWIEATSDRGDMQMSRIVTWYNDNEPSRVQTRPRNFSYYSQLSSGIFFRWEEPSENYGNTITDYFLLGYAVNENDLCKFDGTQDIIFNEQSLGILQLYTDLPAQTLLTHSDLDPGDAICFKIEVEFAGGERSLPAELRIANPYENGSNFSWIDAEVWGEQATLNWIATYPSEIALFEIVKLSSASSSCSREGSLNIDEFELDQLVVKNVHTKNISLMSDENFFCIIVTYRDGSEHRLTYSNEMGNIPIIRGANIVSDSLMLREESGRLKVEAMIQRRYFTTPTPYWVCLDIKLSTLDWDVNDLISVPMTGREADGDSTPNIHDFSYTSGIAAEMGTYDATAWTSSSDNCTYPISNYPASSGIMDSLIVS